MLQYVIVFDANANPASPDGTVVKSVPAACVQAASTAAATNALAPAGVPGLCNIYDEAQWAAVQAGLSGTQLSTDFSGTTSGWDGDWSPRRRLE